MVSICIDFLLVLPLQIPCSVSFPIVKKVIYLWWCNAFSTSSSCVEGWFALILHYYCCEFLVINCDCALSDSCDLALNIFTLPWKQAQLFMHIYVFSLRFDSCNILIFSLYRTYSHDHHIQICVSLRWFLHKCSKKCTHH